MASAGYSGTPLPQKLGIKPGMTLHVVDAPMDYSALIAPVGKKVAFATRLTRLTRALASRHPERVGRRAAWCRSSGRRPRRRAP